jgi:hypothetical protein
VASRICDELDATPGADYLTWMAFVSLSAAVEDFLQRLDKMGMRHLLKVECPPDPDIAVGVVAWRRRSFPVFGEGMFKRAVACVAEYVSPVPSRASALGRSWCERLLLSRPLVRASPLFEGGLLDPDAVENLRRQASDFTFPLWAVGVLVEWSQRNLGSAKGSTVEVAAA